MHKTVLCIGSPEDALDPYIGPGRYMDYWDVIYTSCTDNPVFSAATVGELRGIPLSSVMECVDAIADSSSLYRNYYCIMSPEQMQKLFSLVLSGYEDDVRITFADVHI